MKQQKIVKIVAIGLAVLMLMSTASVLLQILM
mgnify:CR=1 FL=1